MSNAFARLTRHPAVLIALFVGLLMMPTAWAVPTAAVLLGVAALRRLPAGSRSTETARASVTAPDEVVLGVDGGGRPVTLGEHELSAHGLVLGASGAGKSTTLLRLLSTRVSRGAAVVAIDLKGSPTFAAQLAAAARAAGRPFAIWTPDGPGRWNPLQHGNATELKDKLIATERFTEPHYQRAAERYVQMVLQLLLEARPGQRPTLGQVVELMDPQRVAALLRNLPRARAERVQDYIASLSPDQLSAIRGLGTRLAIISESHTGVYLEPAAEGVIDLRRALAGEQVVLFSLNSSRYGKLSTQLGTLAIQDLITAVGDRLASPTRQQAIVAIDEFSALGADNIVSLLARGREAGVSVLLATQELADLDRAARGLRDQVLGNTALKLVHRQDVPASAQTIAQMAGTTKSWEHTYRIGSGPLGRHDTSRGSRRQVEQFVVHPNTIKALRTGEAVVLAKGAGRPPTTVRVSPAASAER